MEYLKQLRRFWFPNLNALWWLLLAFPGLYIYQTTIHEGTHGVVAWINNGDFPKVAPFPHLTPNGNFLNGVTIPDKPEKVVERKSCDRAKVPETNFRLAGWIGWPQVIAVLLVVGLAVIFVFVNISNPYLAFLLRAWLFGAAIDFTFNSAKNLVGICDPSQDWSRVMIRGDINPTLFWFLTLLLWLVILFHIAWVGWPKREPPDELDFWDYRWIAVLLLALSLFALVVTLVVKDDASIDKGSWVYWAGLIGQFLAVIWYMTYIWLTFKHQRPSSQQP
jgi:hypothetical protein